MTHKPLMTFQLELDEDGRVNQTYVVDKLGRKRPLKGQDPFEALLEAIAGKFTRRTALQDYLDVQMAYVRYFTDTVRSMIFPPQTLQLTQRAIDEALLLFEDTPSLTTDYSHSFAAFNLCHLILLHLRGTSDLGSITATRR